MKVLLIHTYYHIRGGEDQVFEQEFDLLSTRHEVMKLSYQNVSGLRGISQFFNMRNNLSSNTQVSDIIKTFNPDIVHIHNLHFAAGYGIIDTIKKYNLPIVMTLHNYRFLCPSGTLFDGKSVFLDSLNSGFPWKAIFKRIFKNSFILTSWLSLVNYYLKKIGTFNKIDKYIVLTNFAKQLYVDSQLDITPTKFVVKPNFVVPTTLPNFRQIGDHFLFVGRLSEEKGILFLLNSLKETQFKLKIIGSGPLENIVIEYCEKYPNNFEFCGKKSHIDVMKSISNCLCIVMSSIWLEPFGLVNVEAFSLGIPVISNNIGAMEFMIQDGINGFLYNGTKERLLIAMGKLQGLNIQEKLTMKRNAYQTYLDSYTAEQSLLKLEELYYNLLK